MKKATRMFFLLISDMILINISYIISFLIRFEFNVEALGFQTFFSIYLENIMILTGIKILVLLISGMYNSLWKYAGIEELNKTVVASFISTAASIFYLVLVQENLPRGIYILTFLLDIFMIGGLRLSYRVFRDIKNYPLPLTKEKNYRRRVMVVGAGDAGATIVKELRNHRELNSVPVIAVDDNKTKYNKRIAGVPIKGTRFDIEKLSEKYGIDEIIIAIPSANKKQIKEIVELCNKTNAKLKILPGLYELIDEKVSINTLRNVDIEDLLGREPVQVNLEEISGYINNKIVLVTGGGGSIGSELCRQIAEYNPKKLIALDIYENSIFEIQNEMKQNNPNIDFRAVIASIRDSIRMREIFEKYSPQVVFHAAAHKHVPLMEMDPKEAVKNNIFGTNNLVDLADDYRVEKFVLISTDKAVNPCNVMGASKRAAEMILQTKSKTSKTQYSAVRFGNVLGSNGSVIPIFKKQIEDGGPITVTHPDVTRFFMTIPEAVQLVIQAGAMAGGGEIFILDMGEPVKIIELAENLIKLSGYKPYEDIDIKIVGLRPGEKLYEELLLQEEGIQKTGHNKIYIGKPLEIDEKLLSNHIQQLSEMMEKDNQTVIKSLEKMIPTYTPNQKK